MFNKSITENVVKFKSNPAKENFVKDLRSRIDDYFKSSNISPYANLEMWVKMFFAVLLWIAVYSLIISDVLSNHPLLLIAAFSLLGFANIFIAFVIVHDAVHDAVSKKKWVNRILARGMDFVGGNSYLLRQMHNEHHLWVNIHGIDVTLETHGLFRFTPHEKWKPLHRFQHFYVPILYSLAQLHWVLFKDFKWFFGESHIGNKKNIRHPLKEYIILILAKANYFTLTLILPLIFLTSPWWIVIIGWISIHILSGLTFALIFQCTHVCEGSHYPMPDDSGNIENNYAIHVLETTVDFCRKSKVGNFLMGCINIHVIHHMFPHICHVHYPKITAILIECAGDYGIQYNEFKTFGEAFKAHLSMLKYLSQKDSFVPEYSEENLRALHAKVA